MGMSHTSVTERKRTQRRLTRRQGKLELARIAQEQIDEAVEDELEAEATFLDSLFDNDYGDAFDFMLRNERKQILEGFDPHRDEAIMGVARFDELISDYIETLGPLTLEQSRQRTNMRIIIADREVGVTLIAMALVLANEDV